jgi:hypothetical protein
MATASGAGSSSTGFGRLAGSRTTTTATFGILRLAADGGYNFHRYA